MLLEQIVNGLSNGAEFALVAVGLTYTLGLARIFNFAYGAFYTLAAFLAISVATHSSIGYLGAVLLGLAGALVVGAFVAIVVVFPAIRRSDMTVMIATLGVSIAMANLGQKFFGSQIQSLPSPLIGLRFSIAGAAVNGQQVLALVATLLVTGALTIVLARTRLGWRLRAAGENRELAEASGINALLTYTVAVVIGIGIAAIAAVVYSPLSIVTTGTGDHVLLLAFAVIAIAGVGRLWGAVIVALGIGIFESLFVAYVNAGYADLIVYAFLVVLLVVRPRGLLGGYE